MLWDSALCFFHMSGDTVFVVTALKEISGLKALTVLFPWKRMPTVMSQESEKESESEGTI